MKRCGIIGILLLGLILIGVTACADDDKETTSQQPAEGDINVTITADGNMEASLQMGLTFGSGGKVDQIFVNKGDKVTEGDALAKLDTAPLETALTQAKVIQAQARITRTKAQIAQAQAQVAQAQAQVAQAQAQTAVTQAREVLAQAQAARTQAEIALNTAEDNLEDAYNHLRWSNRTFDRNDAALKDAEVQYETAQLEFQVAGAQFEAAELQIEVAVSQVETAVSQVETAISQVEITGLQLEISEPQLEVADLQLEATEQALEKAQKQLDEATITAPFDGIVYKIGAKEGEFLSPAAFTGRTIIGIVDLSHMELVARIDELDVVKVKTGQKVMISVDAMPGTKLEGRVTFISPVASEPIGVVLFESDDDVKNYEVNIDFDIPEDLSIMAGMSATAEIIVE